MHDVSLTSITGFQYAQYFLIWFAHKTLHVFLEYDLASTNTSHRLVLTSISTLHIGMRNSTWHLYQIEMSLWYISNWTWVADGLFLMNAYEVYI